MTKGMMIKKIRDLFDGQPIEKAWLFGSMARGDENENSDIDIIVEFSVDSKVSLFYYYQLIESLQKLTRKKVDLVEQGQLNEKAYEDALKDMIVIYEKKADRQG